jgi:hypothetical protein
VAARPEPARTWPSLRRRRSGLRAAQETRLKWYASPITRSIADVFLVYEGRSSFAISYEAVVRHAADTHAISDVCGRHIGATTRRQPRRARPALPVQPVSEPQPKQVPRHARTSHPVQFSTRTSAATSTTRSAGVHCSSSRRCDVRWITRSPGTWHGGACADVVCQGAEGGRTCRFIVGRRGAVERAGERSAAAMTAAALQHGRIGRRDTAVDFMRRVSERWGSGRC